MARELVIYCDESVSKGRFYSNFFGGVLIESTRLDEVVSRLATKKSSLGLTGEMKWQGVTPSVDKRYGSMMDQFFDEVATGKAKVRIMFTQNQHIAQLTHEQKETSYHRLYYQLLRNAFGLEHAGIPGEITRIKLMLDKMPTSEEQTSVFKGYLVALSKQPGFRNAGISIEHGDISEIDSKRHVLAQCLDVVLGAMAFRLNDCHKIKPENSRVRGKRTRVKEQLYKRINGQIREIYPNFNIGVSTGQGSSPNARWKHPYRHWLLKPKHHQLDESKTKSAKRKTP